MTSPVKRPDRHFIPARFHTGWVAGILTLATVAAYHAAFTTPFVFDDIPAIVENASIRHLSSLGNVLNSPLGGGVTVSGRPIVNLSLAINYALGGERVIGYHVGNILIHLATGVLLFGLVRRSLSSPACSAAGVNPELAAFLVSAVWTLHPLQTESVTYVVQRAESLAGLFYVLTLSCFTRAAAPGVSPGRSTSWAVASVAACALAMASKEVAVSAPLIVLLYDRTFIAGSFRRAWHARWPLHTALAATWIILAWLVLSGDARGGTAGIGAGVSSWHYALTQCRAILHYLRLSFWPQPLVFDYGMATVNSLSGVLPQALALLGLLGGTVVALRRAPALGFLGAWFFLLLAPSSSFVPVVTQTMAEHRMYLPLAAVVTLAVTASLKYLGRGGAALCVVAAFALSVVTHARNSDYRSDAAIWADTVAKLPANARAHNNLGQALFRLGQTAEAIRSYERALALQPKYPETHYNLGVARAQAGDLASALELYETALRFDPNYPEAHTNLGNVLVRLGRVPEGILHYREAVRIKPDFAEAHNNLGNALLQSGSPALAIESLQRALQLKPTYPEALYNLGNAFAASDRMSAALEQYQRAIAAQPGYAEAYVNAGNALRQLGRPTEALGQYERAAQLAPQLVEARYNLGSTLLELERWPEAAAVLADVVRTNPGFPEAHRSLGFALVKLGRATEAIPHYEAHLRTAPDDAGARDELAELLRQRRGPPDAVKPPRS